MAKKQSVQKLAREKKKANLRANRERDEKTELLMNDRIALKDILKKQGNSGKQVDTLIATMNDSEVKEALGNFRGADDSDE